MPIMPYSISQWEIWTISILNIPDFEGIAAEDEILSELEEVVDNAVSVSWCQTFSRGLQVVGLTQVWLQLLPPDAHKNLKHLLLEYPVTLVDETKHAGL